MEAGELEYSPACNSNQIEVVPEKRGLMISVLNTEHMVGFVFLITVDVSNWKVFNTLGTHIGQFDQKSFVYYWPNCLTLALEPHSTSPLLSIQPLRILSIIVILTGSSLAGNFSFYKLDRNTVSPGQKCIYIIV